MSGFKWLLSALSMLPFFDRRFSKHRVNRGKNEVELRAGDFPDEFG
jgi:hypothetical protein